MREIVHLQTGQCGNQVMPSIPIAYCQVVVYFGKQIVNNKKDWCQILGSYFR